MKHTILYFSHNDEYNAFHQNDNAQLFLTCTLYKTMINQIYYRLKGMKSPTLLRFVLLLVLPLKISRSSTAINYYTMTENYFKFWPNKIWIQKCFVQLW